MKRLLRLVVSLVSVLMWTTTVAQTPAKVEVIVFAGGFNWPIPLKNSMFGGSRNGVRSKIGGLLRV
jgi:hypothetical protein